MGKFLKTALTAACLSLLCACGRDKELAEEPGDDEQAEVSSAELVLGDSITPGGELEGAVVLKLAPGWHTYGDPPGDSGMPPAVQFNLPDGWDAELQPLPESKKFEDEAGTSFGYEDQLKIKFRLTAPQDATADGAVDIGVDVQWLICKEICLPKSAELKATVAMAETP